MQQLQRTFTDHRAGHPVIDWAKNEVLINVAYALLRHAYGITERQPPDMGHSLNFCAEVRRFEVRLIKRALLYTNSKQSAAARLLNLNPTTLHAKLRHYRIALPVVGAVGDAPADSLIYPERVGCVAGGSMPVSKQGETQCLSKEAATKGEPGNSSAVETLKAEMFHIIARAMAYKAQSGTDVHDFDQWREVDFYAEVAKFERTLLTQALAHTNGNQRAAARLLGLRPTTLNSKVKAYNLYVGSVHTLSHEQGELAAQQASAACALRVSDEMALSKETAARY